MPTIRVIAAVVDTKQLRLYKEDGSTYDILQGDERLAPILKEVTPIVEAGLVATVDLLIPEAEVDTTFKDYEEKSGGFTKFFRVLKKKVSHLFEREEVAVPHVAPIVVGQLPGSQAQAAPAPVVKADTAAAIADIMAHAEPVSNAAYKEEDTTADHTIIAVTPTPNGGTAIVPGAENLKGHIAHATKLKDAKGMEVFLQRLGAAINSRYHSVEDVLKFMERGDLPLADDGSIIAYKVLQTKGDNPDVFVDCHSRKVTQRVGSYVCMDAKMVDRNRRNECSNGLHIARRGYLRGFSGNIMVLCKIAPEDVIAVPHGDANKVRVKGYHILAEIPKDEHANLRDNRAFQTVNAQRLLTLAIRGEHSAPVERVEITEHMGGGVTITPLIEGKVSKPQITKETTATPSLPDPRKLNEPKPLTAPVIDPKALAKELDATKTNVPKTKAEQARVLYTLGKIVELKEFKRAAKKSWTMLGFTPAEEELILSSDVPVTNGQPSPGKMPKAEQVKQEEAVSAVTPVVEAVSEADEPTTNEKVKPKMEGTRAEVARELFTKAAGGDKASWGHLWLHRKECKKSWEILGFTPKEVERIKTNKPDWV